MNFAFWMVFVAAVLPYVTVGLAKSAGLDNSTPRESLERLTGWRKRADWAHRNHFEAFAPFAAAVLIAFLAGVPQHRINLLSGIFVTARVAYTAAYLADRATLRSLIWLVGIVCVGALFVLAAVSPGGS